MIHAAEEPQTINFIRLSSDQILGQSYLLKLGGDVGGGVPAIVDCDLYRRSVLEILSTLPGIDRNGDTVVLVKEGIGDDACDDGDDADDVGDDADDDALGWKTFASALRGRVPIGVIGAVGAEGGAGPSGPLSPVLCLVLQLVTKSSGTKGRRGAVP